MDTFEILKIKCCPECGSVNITVNTCNKDRDFKLWLECLNCELTTYSYKSYLDAVKGWNDLQNINYKER